MLKIANAGTDGFKILTKIEHDTRKKVNDEREAYRQKRSVDKE